MFPGQPSPRPACSSTTALLVCVLGRGRDSHHHVILPEGLKTTWEGYSARHTLLGPGYTWQRLLLWGTEGYLLAEFRIWYTWATLPLPSWCESKAFKLCSFLMQSFLDQTGLSWASHLPPPSSITPEQPARAYSRCPSVTHVSPVHPLCSPWLALTFSDSSRLFFLLLGAESKGWFLHIAKGILCALADLQCRSWGFTPQKQR